MIINQNNINAYMFADLKHPREELRGVLFTEKQTIATNSYFMAIIDNPDVLDDELPSCLYNQADDQVDPVIIPADALKNIKAPKNTTLPILDETATIQKATEGIEIRTVDKELIPTAKRVQKIDAEYPEYKAIIPTKEADQKITLSIDMMKKIFEYLKKTGMYHVEMEIRKDERAPVVFNAITKRNQNIKILIMPIIN